jgi:UDP-N-acetylmuramoyl-L-alanyl-D-glutamate--2,6-diaminopimelate ligase
VQLNHLLKEATSYTHEITGVACDSRAVKAGDAFVAISGAKEEGARYIEAAVKAGASAIVSNHSRPASLPDAIVHVQVKDSRIALAHMASQFYSGQPKTTVAITGTSGKSSVAEFVRQIYAACGHNAACLGTLGLTTSVGIQSGALTTPDPVSLHKTLQHLYASGVTHLAMEASSHGLDQHRLDGVRLSAGAFLNLGRDHLDYHPTMDEYFAAKMRLFDLVQEGRPAVINLDSERGEEATAYARSRGLHVMSVGKEGQSVRLIQASPEKFGQNLKLQAQNQRFDIHLPLMGDFQVQNALMAAAIAMSTGEEAHRVIPALAHLQGVKGRLEHVATVKEASILVDYAHKPEALAAILDTLRPFVTNRLICVIGCGGDRDAGKRPIMGEIASQKADVVIITDDNPRTEDAQSIRSAILKGMKGAHNVREIGNREEAIHTAVHELQSGDVLVVAGKGHETGQIIGTTTLPFSDHEVIKAAVVGMRDE